MIYVSDCCFDERGYVLGLGRLPMVWALPQPIATVTPHRLEETVRKEETRSVILTHLTPSLVEKRDYRDELGVHGPDPASYLPLLLSPRPISPRGAFLS